MPQFSRPSDLVLRAAGICACFMVSTVLAVAFADFGVHSRYLPFLPAIAVCTMLGGRGAGYACVGLSGLSCWYFLVPGTKDTPHLLIFFAVSFFVCWIISLQRRSNDELIQENFELGYKVVLMREIRAHLKRRSADLRLS
jgi:hypothetical protein